MREAQAGSDGGYILHDAHAIQRIDDSWFEPAALRARGWLTGDAAGRGQALFFRHGDTEYALRHYRRGGKLAALLDDRYLYTGLDRTRAWREWRLLTRLTALGLPAPRPLAARVVIAAPFYRADLITHRLMGMKPLSAMLRQTPLPYETWREIGRVIARFHAAGIWHADLNAHNVLLDSRGAAALIDFDRARLRSPAVRWRRANLARLQRSLHKLKRLHTELSFTESDFAALQAGYGRIR